ncbi:leucine-rich repeat and WD repeat-containing protein 1-like [Haliotis rubra]|uniref:leucine-rich repeat and WD repeat-containing protein 1-like n=1 Tax=Haliotis rubra TaxID=36100 RepID=UPI001EE597B6|nr:leucine-rich repeat and WD repeat-containing protein 1-like [Haliotis rubra]XP_046556813.1 leucine-rich repeat and WD repeat-containing protein 1-like [Haliotis rubra]XP_046556814.1 leucine-rich repeat and WD repeat-containing protein 1-like [Haliotis rubra]
MRDRSQLKRKAPSGKTELPPVSDFEPVHFVRCHSADNDPNNNVAKVWRCAFEPVKGKPNESGHILATCGSNIVCFIDCVTGRVLRRYKDTDQTETFYTLAWTTVPSQIDARETVNILAVAGEGAAIKLLHPHQLVMYGTLRGHKKYISCLLFHPRIHHYLFSGSNDGFIMMWDIGTPDLEQNRTDFKPLLKISVPGSEALNLEYSLSSHTLLAACEDGCFGWSMESELKDIHKRRTAKVIMSSTYKFDLQSQSDTVDGLALLPGDVVATKCVGSGSVLLWSLQDHVRSKAKRSGCIKVEPLAELEYTHTDIEYLNMGYGGGLLGVGDDLGNVYVYNVATLARKTVSPYDDILCPSTVVEWPEVVADSRTGIDEEMLHTKKQIVVNGVSISSSSDYIAYGTDNNLVCILKNTQR